MRRSSPRGPRLAASALAGLLLTAGSVCAADVMIRVDTSMSHQSVEGFGATTLSLAFNDVDNVPAALRAKAIDALYNQVHLNMGNLEVGPFESPAGALYSPANDDGDPKTLNPTGFNWTQSDNMMTKVVTPAKAFGFDNFWLGPAISETFEFAWAKALRGSNYDRYLDECAEHVAALAMHWRDAYGITPRFFQLWNEPLSGNGELSGGSTAELTDIVKRAGARLRAEGFATMKFVIPAEETEDLSLEHAAAVLTDPVARSFVGAIAYHPYPYGSTYASVPNILATSGAGKPVASRITVRNALRDLGLKYGIPVMMVEVSHSDVAFGSFDGMRGRAIQIHDEMVYADAAAFFGMNAMWTASRRPSTTPAVLTPVSFLRPTRSSSSTTRPGRCSSRRWAARSVSTRAGCRGAASASTRRPTIRSSRSRRSATRAPAASCSSRSTMRPPRGRCAWT